MAREFINNIAYGVSCGVEIEEELRISLPGQKLGKHNNHF